MSKRSDGCCEQCGYEFYDLHYYHSMNDYADEFKIDCPSCGSTLLVQVYHEPIYGITLDSQSDNFLEDQGLEVSV